MDAKEEIRSRLNIEDVIGEYVQLKRAGRNFKGLSPFSQEKSPSFMVSPEKHIWHDFSSGKGGDVFSFVMEVEGLDFKGALDMLARKAGVDLSQFKTGGDGSLGKKKERLYEVSDLAAKFYHQVFLRTKTALDYTAKRGLNKQVIQEFMIGYSPTNNELMAALGKRGFSERELRDAGLVVTRRFGPSDMFRGRLMIPLMDAQGRAIGFTARILTADPGAPKYINTPQTLLYDKSRHVFGLHLAKEAIRHQDFVVVVEGNADVISSHQVGVKNVVATAGTAMTEHHLRALSRFTQHVRLCFDADKAGVSATERAIAIASNLGITLGIIELPPGGAKDPDELIQQDVKLWQKAITKPKDAVEWLLDEYARRYDLATADGKRRATDQALSVVRAISDPVLLEHYIGVIATRVGASPQAMNKKLNQHAKAAQPKLKESKRGEPLDPEKYHYQDHLLALAWVYPDLRDTLRKLNPECFAGEFRQKLAAHLKDPEADLLQSDQLRVKIGELELIVETKYPALSDELYFDAASIAKRINREHKQICRSRLTEQLFGTTDAAKQQTINKQIKVLDKEIEALKH